MHSLVGKVFFFVWNFCHSLDIWSIPSKLIFMKSSDWAVGEGGELVYAINMNSLNMLSSFLGENI